MATENFRTRKKSVLIKLTAVAADDSAGSIAVTIESNISGRAFVWTMQAMRSGADVTSETKATYDTATGILTIADNGSYAITAGDIFIISGTLAGVA